MLHVKCFLLNINTNLSEKLITSLSKWMLLLHEMEKTKWLLPLVTALLLNYSSSIVLRHLFTCFIHSRLESFLGVNIYISIYIIQVRKAPCLPNLIIWSCDKIWGAPVHNFSFIFDILCAHGYMCLINSWHLLLFPFG